MAIISNYFRVAVLMVTLSKTNGQCVLQNIRIPLVQSSQLTVSWQCFVGNNPHDFEVTYQLTNLDQCQEITNGQVFGLGFSTRTVVRVVPGTAVNEYSTTVSGLSPYSSYAISITGRVIATGNTRTGTISAMTSQEAPSAAPSNFVHLSSQITPTTLTFSFQQISCGSRRGSISYDVEVVNINTNQHVNDAAFSYSYTNDPATVTFSRLLCDTNYQFRVRGNNGGTLTGPYSVRFSGRTSSKGSLSITCPAISQQLVPGSTSQIPSYNLYAVKNGGGVEYVTFNPPLPWNFRAGQTTVTGTATETCYTPDTCAFIVTITNQIDPPATIDKDTILTTSIHFSWSEATCSGLCPNGITEYFYQLLHVATGNLTVSGTTGVDEKEVTIGRLTPCTEYAFSVAGIAEGVRGTFSSEVRGTTDGQAPGEILSVILTPQTYSVRAVWQHASGPCPAETYTVEYRLTIKDQCDHTPDSSRMVWTTDAMPDRTVITGLLPFSTYEVFVRAGNSYGKGPEISMNVNTQPTNVPTASPSNVQVTSTDRTSLSFSWDEVPCGSRHGEITRYNYKLLGENDNIVAGPNLITPNRQITINSGLLQCSTYKFQVGAVGEGGAIGLYSKSMTAMTSTSVTNLNAEPMSSKELVISWEAPTSLCTANVEYEVEYRLTNRGQCEASDGNEFTSESVSDTPLTSPVTLSDLHPYSTYEIQVRASGGVESTTAMTSEAAPSGQPADVNVISTTNTTIEITWDEPICTERNGNITGYTYSLLEMKSSFSIVQDMNTNDTRVLFTDLTPLTSYTFSISANTRSGKGPSYVDEFTTQNAGTGGGPLGSNNNSTAAIAGAISGVFILIILAVILILFLRRRKNKSTSASAGDVPLSEKGKHETDEPDDSHDNPMMNGSHKQLDSSVEPNDSYEEQQEMPKTQTLPAHTRSTSTDTEPKRSTVYHDMDDDDQMEKSPPKAATLGPNTALVKDKKPIPKPKPIKIENLADYIAKHKANRSEGFNAEFEDIPFGQQHPFMIAKKPNNLPKNRFKNISAYDHSRVILEEIKGVPDSDYINASYVKGYTDELYIAGQGPNKGAMGDIWRMAWDQNSTKIVMLTNLVEDGKRKCEKYWPEKAKVPFVYFPITVRLKDVREYADYEVRDVILEKDEESEPREVRWFHFTAWPDMGVPDYPTPLLNFMKVVKAYEPEGSGLPIVHCSAGVGRTGTYITIDATMKMAHAEGKVDINAIVRKLREDRIKMVQTNKQYEFIYDTVQEALTCGDTGILITNLRQGFQDLQQPIKKGKGKTKLEQQFQILDNLTVVRTKQQCRAGYAAENVDKNRFQDLVPWEKRRPYVMTPGGEGSTNYVNATYLDGYVKKNEFISTQMPLPNTVEDFWRLVYSFKSPTIIMLNGMSNSDPSLGTYWIDSGTLPFTSITVEHVKTKPYMDELTGRTFKIYENDTPKDFITVQQFQFNAWPLGQDTPDSTSALISMIDLMEKWQHQQEKKLGKRPITVHCIDGLGVSGVFCALVSVLEKMKVEKVVDVFQSVKRLRMNRAGMVANLEQYTFLYKAAQVSLEELEIYANFAKTE